jgi:DNA modification methylase
MSTWQVLLGDVRETLARIPAGSVQTCVTSPPYWGLRDYGTATWDGGDPACDHDQRRRENDGSSKSATSAGQTRDSVAGRTTCRKCGARRIDAQLGLEPTPAEYVARMVEVFAGVWRVLRDDGTLWLNLGDSYNAGTSAPRSNPDERWNAEFAGRTSHNARNAVSGLKPKDLVGIPWMVAFALRDAGWYLRSDIIWNKCNPMPESVTDRPTKAHEYLFLLTKSARYYYDADAIKEAITSEASIARNRSTPRQIMGAGARQPGGDPTYRQQVNETDAGRNKRSVWTVATQPYPEAHFATYPEALIEPCILAGSKPGDLVLDPFTGSGTTGAVAIRHQRSFVGCELNPAYLDLARRRIGDVAPLLAREVA